MQIFGKCCWNETITIILMWWFIAAEAKKLGSVVMVLPNALKLLYMTDLDKLWIHCLHHFWFKCILMQIVGKCCGRTELTTTLMWWCAVDHYSCLSCCAGPIVSALPNATDLVKLWLHCHRLQPWWICITMQSFWQMLLKRNNHHHITVMVCSGTLLLLKPRSFAP